MKVLMKVVVKVVMKVVDEGDEWLILSCVRGFADIQTDRWTDICQSKVAFVTENYFFKISHTKPLCLISIFHAQK